MTVVIDGTLGVDTIQANTVTSAKIVDGTIVGADLSGGVGNGSLTQYTTAVTPLPAATAVTTVSHGLGVIPAEAVLEFVCLTAEQGYSVGDVIQNPGASNGVFILGSIVWKSLTQVGTGWSSATSGWLILNKTTAAGVVPTASNWSYRFKLRAA